MRVPYDNVKHLWHGTRATDPKLIISKDKEGFDANFSSEGMWGKGFYAAVNASYSNDYRHRVTANNFEFFFVRMNLGKEIFMTYDYKNTDKTRKLQRPPGDHDSVKGNTGGSDVYIVYHNKQTYPEYLISYTNY